MFRPCCATRLKHPSAEPRNRNWRNIRPPNVLPILRHKADSTLRRTTQPELAQHQTPECFAHPASSGRNNPRRTSQPGLAQHPTRECSAHPATRGFRNLRNRPSTLAVIRTVRNLIGPSADAASPLSPRAERASYVRHRPLLLAQHLCRRVALTLNAPMPNNLSD